MPEKAYHVHRCHHCRTRWRCNKPDCLLEDECVSCQVEHFEDWAEANALTQYQPPLVPERALLARKDEDS